MGLMRMAHRNQTQVLFIIIIIITNIMINHTTNIQNFQAGSQSMELTSTNDLLASCAGRTYHKLIQNIFTSGKGLRIVYFK